MYRATTSTLTKLTSLENMSFKHGNHLEAHLSILKKADEIIRQLAHFNTKPIGIQVLGDKQARAPTATEVTAGAAALFSL